MPDNENNPLATPHVVERNGVKETLKVFTGKRDSWKDRNYQAPQIETDGTESAPETDVVFMRGITWTGKSNIKNFLNTIFRRFGQDYVEDATGDEGTPTAGVFSLDRFLSFWANLKSSAMKLSELNEALETAIENYKVSTEALVAAFESGEPVAINNAKQAQAISSSSLKALQIESAERKAKRSKEAQAETLAAV